MPRCAGRSAKAAAPARKQLDKSLRRNWLAVTRPIQRKHRGRGGCAAASRADRARAARRLFGHTRLHRCEHEWRARSANRRSRLAASTPTRRRSRAQQAVGQNLASYVRRSDYTALHSAHRSGPDDIRRSSIAGAAMQEVSDQYDSDFEGPDQGIDVRGWSSVLEFMQSLL